ncbi:cytochrome c oxidase assembly protein [Naumannella sp. ID2617S]|nr:cytochrome c oxidase assembly protein [Naumannella sp. ID2617S]
MSTDPEDTTTRHDADPPDAEDPTHAEVTVDSVGQVLETRTGWLPVWVSAGMAMLVVAGAVAHQTTLPPLRGREFSDPLTNQLTGLVDLITQLAMLTTLGLLLAAAHFAPVRRRHHELSAQGRGLARLAGTTAAVWFAGALLLVPLTAGENNGVSVLTALPALIPFLSVTQSAAAWLFPAAIALVTVFAARRVRQLGAVLALLVVGGVWQLATVLTGNVSVGADHDFGSDAAIIATLAQTVAITATVAVLATAVAYSGAGRLERRQRRLVGWALPFVLAGWSVVTWYELAGAAPLATGYGVLRVGALTLWALLGVRLLVASLRRQARSRTAIGVDLAMAVLAVGLQVATAHLAPPRFLEPQTSAQINYLGFELPHPPTLAALVLPGRPNLLIVTVSLLAIAVYLAAYLVLRRRGIVWSGVRLGAWLAGWVVMLWATGSGIWAYSGATFSKHMLVHMTVNMLAPALIVLGAPATLLLRVLPTHQDNQPAGVRELITGLVGWKPLEILLHPVLVGLNFVGAFYLIYFSDLFGYLMRYHWGHQLMTVHFILSGLVFFGLVAGSDRMPRELPHVAKLGFLFAVMPFHAFFAVALLSTDGIIGENFYRSLDLPWMTNLLADQKTGGQFTWALGELPMLVVVVALVFQWFRQDARDAKRQDRAMDSGLDDSFEAYNEMLKKLSERADR